MSVARYLLCEVKGLEPEGKYLLVRLLLSYSAVGRFVSTAAELSESFGVWVSSVAKTLNLLEAQGLLSVASAPNGRGRPKRKFTFTKRLTVLLEKVKLPVEYEPAFGIEPFLTVDKKDQTENQVERPDWCDGVLVPKGKRGSLSIANRLLIAVLLTKADRFGVVTSLGLADLRKATGLSKERLIYRLARLVSIGVIRGCVPGATGQRFFWLAKSIYFLNFADPELSILGLRPVVVIKQFEREAFTGWSSLLGSVYESARQPGFRVGVGDPELESLRRLTLYRDFFEVSDWRRLSSTLEVRLLAFASALLSKHWELIPSELAPISNPPPVPELQKAIAEQFSPHVKDTKEAKEAKDAKDALAKERLLGVHACLWEAVFRKATEIKFLILSLGERQLEQLEYMALPGSLENAFLTLLVLPKADSPLSGCYFWAGACSWPKRYLSESEIFVSSRLNYGLLSEPKRRAGRHSGLAE